MGRTPCCEKVGLKKGPWTPEEDQKLVSYIEQHGHGSWRALPSKAGLQRCGKSCRLRWTNYLRPDIKRGKFNVQEEQTIIQLHALLGNRWSAIATHLPKRTDNEIKNYWNTHIKKRLTKMGIDPITHRRRISTIGIGGTAKNAANLSHMAQWENARLEAEARLVREAKLASGTNQLAQQNSSARLVDKSTLLRPIRPQPLCLDVLKAWQGIMLSKLSNGITLESPTSTLNFSDNATTIPCTGFAESQCMSMVDYVSCMPNQDPIIEENIQNDSNMVPQTIKTKMENSSELDQIVYPNNAFPMIMEGFTELLDVACTQNLSENNNIDLEENWNNILNDLANSSPLGSPVF